MTHPPHPETDTNEAAASHREPNGSREHSPADPWSQVMHAGRRWMEELGRHVQVAARPPGPAVGPRDLASVVEVLTALGDKVEAHERRAADAEARLVSAEARIAGLAGQLTALADALSAALGRLPSEPGPVAKGTARRGTRAGKEAAGESGAGAATEAAPRRGSPGRRRS